MSCLRLRTKLSLILNTLYSHKSLHTPQITRKRLVLFKAESGSCLYVYKHVYFEGDVMLCQFNFNFDGKAQIC